jgi:hypothetical protein
VADPDGHLAGVCGQLPQELEEHHLLLNGFQDRHETPEIGGGARQIGGPGQHQALLTVRLDSRADGGGWAAIEGATGASHTPLTDTARTFIYYVKVTNTNNGVNGTKTASTDSREATVAVMTAVDAKAPVISAQPQSATYVLNAQPAALTVAATSPDGGTLSYQWQSGANSGGPWAAISGATGASYAPPSSAVYQIVYYRVTITNTNNGATGAKTAVTDSGEAAITLAPDNAAAPLISAHPQSAAYHLDAAAGPLTVAASSPDGGTLSYQWQSRAGLNGQWTTMPGATGTSITPSTAPAGTVYYRVEVTNTNTTVITGGNTVATTRSEEAAIQTNVGTGSFVLVWVTEGGSIVSDMPANLRISRALEEHFVITAADNLTDLQWSINGGDLPAPRGTHQSIVIEAVDFVPRTYILGLRAKAGGVPYSISVTFEAVN